MDGISFRLNIHTYIYNKYSPSLYKIGLLPSCDIISMYSNTYSMILLKKKTKRAEFMFDLVIQAKGVPRIFHTIQEKAVSFSSLRRSLLKTLQQTPSRVIFEPRTTFRP